MKLRVRVRPTGPNLQLILAADDRLQLAIQLRNADRETGGVSADAWRAWWAEVAALPADMSQNDRARAILDKPLPA